MEAQSYSGEELITRSKDVMSGTPVFRDTRVPVQTLFDYLEAGDSLDIFLDDFPSVTREQAMRAMQFGRMILGE